MVRMVESENPSENELQVVQSTEESPQKCFLTISNIMNETKIQEKDMTVNQIPDVVHAEIRHLVQLLSHDEPGYRTASLALLEGLMMKYPVLSTCVANNVFYRYSKKSKLDRLSKESRQAKLMGIGCIIRSGTVFENHPLLMRLVSELLINRIACDKDDIDIFFLISALQHDSAVKNISEIILSSMSKELSSDISSMKLSTVWLRVTLAKRMIETGIELPQYLQDTFLPHNIELMGQLFFPKSEKVEPIHPALDSFLPSLSVYHKHWLAKYNTKRNKAKDIRQQQNPVAVFFKNCLGTSIMKYFRVPKKLLVLKVALRMLKSVIVDVEMDLELLESITHWLYTEGGVDSLHRDMRDNLIKVVLAQSQRLINEVKSDKEKSEICKCVMSSAEVLPEMLSTATQMMCYLTTESAKEFVEGILNNMTRKVTQTQASVVLKILPMKQYVGEDNRDWKLQLTETLVKRAVRSAPLWTAEELQNEDQDEDNEVPKKEYKPFHIRKMEKIYVDDRDFLYRYLNVVCEDKSTINDVLYTAHVTLEECVRKNSSVLELPEDIMETWNGIARRIKELHQKTDEEFKLRRIFLMLLCQFSLEYLKEPGKSQYSQELASDLLLCLDTALKSETTCGTALTNGVLETKTSKKKKTNSKRKAAVKNEEEELTSQPESNWQLVLVDILMAVAAKDEAWWRVVLHPAGKALGSIIYTDSLDVVMDVLLKDDTVKADGYNDSDDEESDDGGERGDEEGANSAEEQEVDEEEGYESGEEQEGDDEGQGSSDEGSNDEESGEEGSDDEESGEEENDEYEAVYVDSSDDDDDENELNDDYAKESELEALKKNISDAMGDVGGEGEDEDMDAIPIQVMRQMDKKLGKIFKQFKFITNQREKRKLCGIDLELMEYRNRVLDFVEGVVDGSPSASILLSNINMPLLQVLRFHNPDKFKQLACKVSTILKNIRAKKPSTMEGITSEDCMNAITESFSYARYIPECYYGVVLALKYSLCLPKDQSNAVLEFYIENVKKMLLSKNINKQLIADVINIEVPGLRSKLIDAIVSTGSFNANNNAKVSRRLRHSVWELMHMVALKMQTSSKLNKDEEVAFRSMGEHLIKYLQTTDAPARKTLAPLSMIVKMFRKCSDWGHLFNWDEVGRAVLEFRTRICSESEVSNNLRKDLDRLVSITQVCVNPHDANLIKSQASQQKQDAKRKRREKRQSKLEKRQKRMKLDPDVSKTEPCLDDEDSDEETNKDTKEKRLARQLKLEIDNENEALVEMKRAKRRAKKLKAKANRAEKKILRQNLKEEETKKAEENKIEDEQSSLQEKKLESPEANIKRAVKVNYKRNRFETDKKLSADLRPGIFAAASHIDVEDMYAE